MYLFFPSSLQEMMVALTIVPPPRPSHQDLRTSMWQPLLWLAVSLNSNPAPSVSWSLWGYSMAFQYSADSSADSKLDFEAGKVAPRWKAGR